MNIKKELNRIAYDIVAANLTFLLKQAIGRFNKISDKDIMSLQEFKGIPWKRILNSLIDLENKGIITVNRDSFTDDIIYRKGPKFS